MALIALDAVGVRMPIYNARTRSLRSRLSKSVGGVVGSNSDDIVVVDALRDITLQARAGDRIALIGHNGAGKSTLLRVMAGAFTPTSGVATIEGRISSLLDISVGFDGEMTGRENIVLRTVMLGMNFRQASRIVDAVEDFANLGPYLDLPMRTYSSGMVLRLAFGASTAVHADIILLDEIIGVGDAAFAEKARDRLDAMIGTASILVLASHDPTALQRYCTTAVVLEHGRIMMQGSVDDALAAFAAARAA